MVQVEGNDATVALKPANLQRVRRHGQSGGLGWAIAAHHGLVRLHLKAWGWPSDS